MSKRLLTSSLFLFFCGIIFSTYSQNAPGSFAGTASGTTITLTWAPEGADPNNDGYLIKAKRNPGGSFPATPAFASLPITDDADLTDGAGMIQLTDEDLGTYNGFTNIVAGAQYDFEIYTYDNNSISTAASTTVYTLATAPGAFPGGFTFTATPAATQIDLAFTKASRVPMAGHGYLILRRAGSNPDLTGVSDGNAPGGTYHIATITDSTATAYSDNTALGGVTYHYALVPYRVGFNVATPINQTYNYGSLSSFATATIPLVTTIDELTGGIAAPPLASSSPTQAILGFSIVSNGTPNFTAINIQVTSSALNKFSNAYLYQSANNSFGGDSPVGSVTDNLTGTQIQLSGFSVPLSSTPQYFFIVVDVQDTVSASSPTLTPSFTNANITISGGGTVTVNSSPITGTTYTFIDNSPPTISSRTPSNGATGVSVLLNSFSITFNEPVAYVGDNSNDPNRIRIWDDDANVFVETINVIDVSVVGNVATFITDFTFAPNTDYDIVIGNSVFEDLPGNAFAGIAEDAWEFRTEAAPNISSLSNLTRCIADQLTINGTGFVGTGGSGSTKPFVYINGVQVPAVNITAFNNTTITLTVPSGVSTGNVTVQNRDNFLTSNGSALTVHPQINTGLTVTPATTSPAQNTNVNINIGLSQASYTYDLVLTAKPVGYSVTIGNSVHTAAGGANPLTLNTSEGADPDLTHIGDYSYRIDVSRAGCTTRPLTSTVDLTVAALTATVNATSTSVCLGSSSILIGSTSGGTGFYQFSWSGPNGFSSTSSSPTITPAHPAGTGWYILTLSDNSANEAKDSVYITTFPVPTATIVPNAGETAVRVNYVIEDRDYLVTGSPAGGVFTGPGILLSNGNYYFNPFNATLGNHLITYTYTDVNGCQDTDTRNFVVQSLTVNGVDQLYCRSTNTDAGINVNIANAIRPGYQFTRLRFYAYYLGTVYYDTYQIPAIVGTPPAFGMPPGATYPLTVTSTVTVDDASTVAVDAITVPNTYTLNLDAIRNGWGFGYYYLDVFAKDQFGNEVLQSWAWFQVADNGPAPAIVGINEGENVCADANVITLTASEPGYTITDFNITPGTFNAALSGTNDEDFDPSDASLVGADERPLTISMDYNDFNNCPNTVVRNFNWVKKPLAPIAPDVSYCKITTGIPGTFTINASPNGPGSNPYWYELDPVSNPTTPILDSVNFLGFIAPGITGLTALSKDFYVTQSYKGCEGSVTVVNLEIREAPDASITPDPICEDRDFIIAGPQESPGVPYALYEWTFGDGQSESVANDSLVIHNYGPGSGSTPYVIGLTVTNSLGCSNTDAIPVTVGLNPKPDFTYNFVCENDNTQFNASTDIAVTEFEWDFGDFTTIPRGASASPAPEGGTVEDPIHQFANGVDDYSVTVTSYTGLGCFNTKIKTVSILEYLTHTSGTPYDMSAVDGGAGYWKLEDLAGNSTWEFAQPTSPYMDEFTSPAWVTNAVGNYASGEESFLNSPCLNISGIARPVLSFDFILNTDLNRDGVVLEYSDDNGLNWYSLGQANSGFNWFNTTGFFTGTIGSSTIGWSGNSWELDDTTPGDTLTQARKALDNISGVPGNPNGLTLAERSKVRFRIAFKTDNNRELDGIAFNNLTIASRNRILLVENFTNESDGAYGTNNTNFKNIPITEAVKIQYHLGYPGADTNYPVNPADPSARSAYYGIPLNDNYIPRGYIDGYSDGNFNGVTWVTDKFSERSLKVAPYTLPVTTLPSSDPTYLKVAVTVTALENIPGTWNPILQIALVEKTQGTDNEFVLRKLVPSAIGRVLAAPMVQGTVVNIIDSVRIEHPDIEISDLAIVAFIQDELTREVYQAGIDLMPTNLPDQNLITDIEDPAYAEKINLFPNPANHGLNIELPAVVTRETPVVMFDTYGRAVYQGAFKEGEHRKSVNTTELTGGVYIVQIGTPEGGVARRKVMVVHR